MSNSSQEGLHILVFPYPAQGHMLPMLEKEYWDQLRNVMGQGHVWSVGPLYLLGGERTLGRVNPDVDSSGGVMGWLDGCPDRMGLSCMCVLAFWESEIAGKQPNEGSSKRA